MVSQIRSVLVIMLLTAPLAWNQERSLSIADPPQQVTGATISAARLGVPRKARDLYEKAKKPFLKHDDVEAQEKLNQALHLDPVFPEALTLLGYIQLELNQLEPAEQNLRAAVRSDPTYARAYLVLSRLYNLQGRFDDAIEQAQRANALMPGGWMIPYEMCISFMKKHQYATALNLSDLALRTNPGTLLLVAKAHALLGLDRYPEAIVELKAYLQYQPAGDGSQDAHDLLSRIQKAPQQGTQ